MVKKDEPESGKERGTSADIPAMKAPKVGVSSGAPNEGTPRKITNLPKGGRRIDY